MIISGPTVDHGEIRSWGERHRMLPMEVLPDRVDHEPTQLCLSSATAAAKRHDLRTISWEDFFMRFDLLGLALVYDNDHPNFNKLLQREFLAPKIANLLRQSTQDS